MVPLSGVVGLFLLTRDRQIPSRAPDMAIRREQSSRGGTSQSNNTLQGDYPRLNARRSASTSLQAEPQAESSEKSYLGGFRNGVRLAFNLSSNGKSHWEVAQQLG